MRYVPAILLLALVACGSQSGDPPVSKGVPAVGGKDLRIRDIGDPSLPEHAGYIQQTQPVSGAVVTAVDTYDETHDGKGMGTLYIQDIGPAEPYSGMSLFATTFSPGNLRVSVGDVLDLRGQYQEAGDRGPTAMFPPGSVQAQIAFGTASFRYETKAPEPVDIDLADLNDFTKGRRWIGMLVRVKDVTVARDTYTASSGRASIDLTPLPLASGCNAPFPKSVQLVNDLVDLEPLGLKEGSKVKSIVGVVGFFCSIHLAPRSQADIQL